MVCIGFGAGRVPVFRSIVAATVDPLKQGKHIIIIIGAEELIYFKKPTTGEAMASIEMVSSIGVIFSPIIMGSILTSCVLVSSYQKTRNSLHPIC